MSKSSLPRAGRAGGWRPRALGLTLGLALAGCGGRSLPDIEREMRSLDLLYLTADSGKEVVAPATRGVFVDEATGELCFPAYACANPDCPGSKGADRPCLFIHRDVMLRAGTNGEIVRDEMPPDRNPVDVIKSRGGFPNPTCPACWELRKGKAETPAETQQFVEWARPYMPPRSAERMKQLEEEYQRKLAEKNAARRRPARKP